MVEYVLHIKLFHRREEPHVRPTQCQILWYPTEESFSAGLDTGNEGGEMAEDSQGWLGGRMFWWGAAKLRKGIAYID